MLQALSPAGAMMKHCASGAARLCSAAFTWASHAHSSSSSGRQPARPACQPAAVRRTMEQAFKDLRALMGKAQDMVSLAQRFREKSSAGMDRAPEEVMDAEMENELISLGIASPVTKSTAGALYHQQLSRQVGLQCLTRPACICTIAAWIRSVRTLLMTGMASC